MNRRNVFKSVAAAFGGLAAASSSASIAKGEKPGISGTKVRQIPFIATSDGTWLFYREWGAGRPVVFLAPWGLHSGWWERQMAYLAGQGVRCIACDRRGHGRSSEPVGGYEFDRLADDLNTVVEELDLRDVTLVGHSMGCGEVVRFLSRRGARRIARIVMVAPITPQSVKTADNPDGIEPAALEQVRQALSRDRPHAIAAAAPAFFGAPKNAVSVETMQWWSCNGHSPKPTFATSCKRSRCRRSSFTAITIPLLQLTSQGERRPA